MGEIVVCVQPRFMGRVTFGIMSFIGDSMVAFERGVDMSDGSASDHIEKLRRDPRFATVAVSIVVDANYVGPVRASIIASQCKNVRDIGGWDFRVTKTGSTGPENITRMFHDKLHPTLV